jgi:outer membrane protein assembly factor BamB
MKWKYKTGGNVGSSPAIGSDGTVYFGSWDGLLYSISAVALPKFAWQMFRYDAGHTGLSPFVGSPTPTMKWKFSTGAEVDSSPALGSDGTVYVVSDDYNLYAINPDGTKKWSLVTGEDPVSSSPAIGSDGTLYIDDGNNRLYAINPDGTMKWSLRLGGVVGSSPAIGSDGTLYVGSGDNNIYAISEVAAKCTKTSLAVGSSMTCKATVKGFSPTGSVTWSSSVAGKFSKLSCKLSKGACSVRFTPTTAGSSVTITASYGGDSKNPPFSGTARLVVTMKPSKTPSPADQSLCMLDPPPRAPRPSQATIPQGHSPGPRQGAPALSRSARTHAR